MHNNMVKYEWYGSEWLALRDMFSRLTTQEIILTETSPYPIGLLSNKELAYLNGAKQNLFRSIATVSAVNRILYKASLKEDKKEFNKYKALFIERGLVVDYSNMMIPPKEKELSMFK